VLAGIGALSFVLTALGVSWQVGTSIGDRQLGSAAGALGVGALTLLFWWWITLGSWTRFRPPADPETGLPIRHEEPVGPWGVVGRVLVVVLVATFVAGGLWLASEARTATRAAEQVRDRAERLANERNLTVADVEQARADALVWTLDPTGPDPYDELLDVPGASVDDVSVDDDGDRAAVLLRLPSSPPCVVVDIDADDLVSTRITNSCD
jgi:hypothetical protein